MYHPARYPNADPDDQVRGGWLLVDDPSPHGALGSAVAGIHNEGDYLQWQVNIPAARTYDIWIYAAIGAGEISGNTTLAPDGGDPVVLQHMTDTGGWGQFRWHHAGRIALDRGRRALQWTNVKGGGLNFDAMLLTDEADFQPAAVDLPAPAPDDHRVVIQAETFTQARGKDLSVSKLSRKDRFTYAANDLQAWPRSPEKRLHIYPAWGWVNCIVPIDRIDTDRQVVWLETPCNDDIRVGNRYYISNVREELDAPGEFYLDRTTGELLLMAERDQLTDEPVVAPVLKRVFFLKGRGPDDRAEHIHFEGLTFRDTRFSVPIRSYYVPPDGAIAMQDAADCRVERCVFEYLGGWAVVMVAASEDNRFADNVVHDVGQGGVLMEGIPRYSAKPVTQLLGGTEFGGFDLTGHRAPGSGPSRNVISGNHMWHLGTVYAHVAGIMMRESHDNEVSHNDIHDVPRYAISLKDGCGQNRIIYNDCRRTNLQTNDTGAIELFQTVNGNLIDHPVGLRVTEQKQFRTPDWCWGLYFDEWASNQTITNNIVVGGFLNIAFNRGWDNLVQNNIFVNAQARLFDLNLADKNNHGSRMVRNIFFVDTGEPVGLRITRWNAARENLQIDQNLYWINGAGPAWIGFFTEWPDGMPDTAAGMWDRWRELGFDTRSVIADPLFVDPATYDFRLEPQSPALKMGFEPIDVSRIGLKGYTPTR